MFENLRQSLKDLASGAVPPAQRGAAIAHMRATLVQARAPLLGEAALRIGHLQTRARKRDSCH